MSRMVTLERRLEEASNEVYQYHLANVNVFTQDLKDNAYVNGEVTSKDTFLIEIGNRSKHAVYVEYGTGQFRGRRDSWIVPKSLIPDADRAIETYHFKLYGYGERDGEPLYIVHGQAPKYFLSDTYFGITAIIDDIVREVFEW